MPDMIKYRYPAPGSAALDRVDHPNLFKKHWKTPFRNSPYNIRVKEKTYGAENEDNYMSALPDIDPSRGDFERRLALQQETSTDHTKAIDECTAEDIWAEQEADADVMRVLTRDFTHSHWDLDEEYDQVTFMVGGYDKDYSGISNDARMRQICTEYEYWIEEVIGEKRIREQKFKMYKGTVKKWQVLDDDAFDRDQVELL